MRATSLEKRVAELERQVKELVSGHEANGASNNWRDTIGAFTGDDVMQSILDEGRKIREREQRAARKGTKKVRTSRS